MPTVPIMLFSMGYRAVLALDSLDFKKHSVVIAKFRERYIKSGVFDISFSRIIGEAFDLGGECDYEDFYLVTKQEVEEQIQNASVFLKAVEEYMVEKNLRIMMVRRFSIR